VFATTKEAVAQVGSGEADKPLARPEATFLEVSKKLKLKTTEVIRVLGPFPNCKNLLTGGIAVDGSSSQIKYASMIDSTGKTLMPLDDVRKVPIEIVLLSEDAMVLDLGNSNQLVFEVCEKQEMAEELKALGLTDD